MSSFRNIGHCEIPNDWADISLGDEYKRPLLVMRNGLTKTQNDHDGTFKVSRIETISNGVIDESRVKYLSEVSREEEDKYLIRKNDILFSHINSDAHLGKTAIAKKDYDDLLHGMNLLLFRVNEEILDPEFLFFTTNYYKNIGVFISIGSRAVNQSSINQGKLKALKVPLPPLPEQRNIAHILSKIQSAIETQEKIIQTTTELKKALMQKLFTEGLKGEPQKETEIGLVPKSWKIKKIRELVLETETRNPEKEPNKCIKYIDVSSVSNDTFSVICHQDFLGKDAPGRARKVVNTDDVIFATIRPTLKRVAKIMPEYDDQYCSTAFCVLRVGKDRLDFEYLYQYLLTDFFIKEIGKLQSGASYPAVRDDDVKRMKIPYPSIEEQEKISSILKQLDCKKAFAIKKSLLLQSLFKSMLHHLMTGQIRVKDLRF